MDFAMECWSEPRPSVVHRLWEIWWIVWSRRIKTFNTQALLSWSSVDDTMRLTQIDSIISIVVKTINNHNIPWHDEELYKRLLKIPIAITLDDYGPWQLIQSKFIITMSISLIHRLNAYTLWPDPEIHRSMPLRLIH